MKKYIQVHSFFSSLLLIFFGRLLRKKEEILGLIFDATLFSLSLNDVFCLFVNVFIQNQTTNTKHFSSSFYFFVTVVMVSWKS